MDTAKIKQKILYLDRRRRKLIGHVLDLQPMIGGSLYQMHRRCGNPRCKCARGHLHASWYLSERRQGRTKLAYIGRTVPRWLTQRARRYQRQQKSLASIRKMDVEISKTLRVVCKGHVKNIQHIRKETQ